MADDPRDRDRKPKSHKTPTGLPTMPEERDLRRTHRDYASERPSRAIPALPRDPFVDNDAVPREEMNEATTNTPVGLTPVQSAEFHAQRAQSRSNIAYREAQSVRVEMREEITALNTKFDTLASKLAEIDGRLETWSAVMTRQLEANQKQMELTLAALLGAKQVDSQARADEVKASGAHKREIWNKVVVALLGILVALQVYYLGK